MTDSDSAEDSLSRSSTSTLAALTPGLDARKDDTRSIKLDEGLDSNTDTDTDTDTDGGALL